MSFSKAFANCNAYNHSSSKYSDEGTISPSHLDHLTNYQQPRDNQATWIPPMEEKKASGKELSLLSVWSLLQQASVDFLCIIKMFSL